jgi:hypothetical protein
MRLMLTALALALTACGSASAPSATQSGNAETGTPTAGEPPAPSAESIPARFRGVWAEGRAACAQLSHPSRLIISERVIRYPSLVLVGESVELADPGVAVKGYNQRTGAPADAHFSIDATGNILTDEADAGAVRVRCG